MAEVNSVEQIEIQSIVLESPRGAGPVILYGQGVASTTVVEINIYENITLPYLTGNIILADDNALEDGANLLGSEKITITLKSPYDSSSPFEKVFYVASIAQSVKSNDNSAVLMLNLIEDVGYYDKLTTMSKSYEGTGEEIIYNMLTDVFAKPINTFKMGNSAQAPFRYIIPYVPTFKAINAILQKITSVNGLPFFCFRTLTSDAFVIRDLESIFKTGAFNVGNPFVLSQTNNSTSDFTKQSLNIYAMENVGTMEDTLKLIQHGAVGSLLTTLNVNAGNRQEQLAKATEVVGALVDQGILPKNQRVELIDRHFKPDPSERNGNLLDDYPAKTFSLIESSPYPLSGLNGYNEEKYFSDHLLKIIRHSVTMLLQKNVYSIHVPGITFLENESAATVGSLIELKIPSNAIPNSQSTESDLIDTKKSGNFLILSKRHMINVSERNETHTVSMEVGRISSLESVR